VIVFGTLIIAACLVSGMVIVASYRAQKYSASGRAWPDLPPVRATDPEPDLPDGVLDIAAELRMACIKYAPVVAERLVDMDTAVLPGLLVRADRAVVRAALDGVLSESLMSAAYGRLLLSAFRLEPWVHITLTDDNATMDQDRRVAALRDTAQAVALQGGSLSVEARPEGGTVTIRLPAVISDADPSPRATPVQSAPSVRLVSD
jgi:hypothetical protein